MTPPGWEGSTVLQGWEANTMPGELGSTRLQESGNTMRPPCTTTQLLKCLLGKTSTKAFYISFKIIFRLWDLCLIHQLGLLILFLKQCCVPFHKEWGITGSRRAVRTSLKLMFAHISTKHIIRILTFHEVVVGKMIPPQLESLFTFPSISCNVRVSKPIVLVK